MVPLHVLQPKDPKGPTSDDSDLLSEILGKAAKAAKGPDDRQVTPQLIRGRFFVYRYESEKRTTDPPRSPSGTKVQTQGYEKDTGADALR